MASILTFSPPESPRRAEDVSVRSPRAPLVQAAASSEGQRGSPVGLLDVVFLSGVEPGSRLAQVVSARLSGMALVDAGASGDSGSDKWRKAVAGTALQWFAAGGRSRPAPPEASVIVDLHGKASGAAGRLWRIVDAAGRCVLTPFFAMLPECRRAGLVALHLIESRDGGARWIQLADVHLSALQDYRVLLEGMGHAVAALLAAGLQPKRAPSPWHAAPRGRWGAAARLRFRAGGALTRLGNYLSCELWGIGILDLKPLDLLSVGTARVGQWIEIAPQEGYVADPFPWPGRTDRILCERFSHDTGRGSLQALAVVEGRIAGAEDLPAGFDGHLSYPFAWVHAGRTLCLPEMGASRRQVLYELSGEALMRPVATVAEGVVMADPTFFRHGNLYWIAYTDGERGLYDNLCLLWAERLEGPWHPHPGNPVKIDVRSSRGAGAPFQIDDWLIRPAQNCTRTYGGSVVFNRILRCTPTEYQEEEVATLSPDPAGRFAKGLHTVNLYGDVVLVDGKRYAFDLRVLRRRVQRRLRPALRRIAGLPRASSGQPSASPSGQG